MEERSGQKQSVGEPKTTGKADDGLKAEVRLLWEAILDIEKKSASSEVACETEADSLWKAMSVIDTKLDLLKEEFDQKMIALYQSCTKKVPKK